MSKEFALAQHGGPTSHPPCSPQEAAEEDFLAPRNADTPSENEQIENLLNDAW